MTSMARGANAERTNRWLLIGALVLAVVAGVLVFVALANTGSGDANPKAAAGGDKTVLVAKETIAANTTIRQGMFEQRSISQSAMVPGAVSDETAAIGQVTRSEILRNQQLSVRALAASEAKNSPFSNTIPPNKRAVSINVSENTSVAGLLVPGDRVDVVVTFKEQRSGGGNSDNEITRVNTVLQDVEVLAFAQQALDVLPPARAAGTPVAGETPLATDQASGVLGSQPTDVKPNPRAGTATLALGPQDVQVIVAAQSKGVITLALRRPGEKDAVPLQDTNLDSFGFLGPLPRP